METGKTFSISDLQGKLAEVEAEANKIKKTINFLCELSGDPPIYTETDFECTKPVSNKLVGDEYHGRPQATVITEILESRKNRGLGPAMLDELYDEMVAGGHQFKGNSDPIKKRGLSIAMSKNPKFYRLPNEKWGLLEWYPNAKKQKPVVNNQNEAPGEEQENDLPEEGEQDIESNEKP